MTTILLILLAAVGIGGGLAASGGSSGGSDSGYETPVQPGEKPEIISLLTSIDRYQQTQQVGEISVAESTLIVSGERPVVENGRFKYNIDPDRGELEDVYEPYTVSIGVNDYTHSDTYADYYEHQGTAIKGLYNNKELSSEPDNWIYMEAVPRDILALGGQKLGLKNSDFGYHNNSISFSPFGELPWYEPFYLYDTTKIASSNRTDTATYQGHLLGGVELVETESGYSAGEDFLPFTGDINLNIDFANRNLNGDMATALASLSWYKFNLSGNLSSSSDFNVNSVSINHNSQPDSALSKYSLNSVNDATGSGKLLEGETQDEIVGKLSFWGENSQYSIFVATSFGAISPKSTENLPPPTYLSELTNNQFLTTHLISNDHYGNFLGNMQFGNGKISVSTDVPLVQNGKFQQQIVDGYLETLTETKIVDFIVKDFVSSDTYADYFSKNIGTWSGLWNNKAMEDEPDNYIQMTATIDEKLALGGRLAGLKNAEFGYRQQTSQATAFEPSSYYYTFYAYNNTALSSAYRSDTAYYTGNMLGSVSTFIGEEEMLTSRALQGTANFVFDFANTNLSGKILASSEGKEWGSLSVQGNIASPSDFSISNVQLENMSSGNSDNWTIISAMGGNGNGKILASEIVGDISLEGWNSQNKFVSAYMSFGAKEQK